MKTQKVLVISNLIYPLRVPVFECLNNWKHFDYHFLFLRKTLGNRKWKTDTEKLKFKNNVIPGIEIPLKGRDYFPLIINPTILANLWREDFSLVISIGWAYPANLLAFLYCKLTSRYFIIWNESTENEYSWRRLLSLPMVKFMVKFSDGFLASGSRAKNYLVKLGAKPNLVMTLGNAIDNKFYKTRADKIRLDKDFRSKTGFKKNDFILAYIGRFEKVKGLDLLLESFSQVVIENKRLKLLLIGYGSLKNDLEEMITKLSINNIYMLGPFEREELIRYYCLADVIILPSYSETWGYVLNEALACSVPVIASSAVGAVGDLVIHKKNGLVFKSGDKDSLTKSIIDISSDPKMYEELRKNCYKTVSKFNFLKMSQTLEKMVFQVLSQTNG